MALLRYVLALRMPHAFRRPFVRVLSKNTPHLLIPVYTPPFPLDEVGAAKAAKRVMSHYFKVAPPGFIGYPAVAVACSSLPFSSFHG